MHVKRNNRTAPPAGRESIVLLKARWGLPFKLLTSFLIVALVPLGLVLFLNIQATRTSLETEAYKSLYASASHTALRLNAFTESNLNVIQAEAKLPALAAFCELSPQAQGSSPMRGQVLSILSSLTGKNRVFLSSYALIDLDGKNILDTDPRNIGKNLSGRSYFIQALETGLPAFSDVEFDQRGGEAYIYFSCIIHNSRGLPVGVLRSRYSAAVLQQLIIQDTGLVGSSSFAMLLNEHHLMLAFGIFSHGGAEEMVFSSVAPLSQEQAAHLQRQRLLPPKTLEQLTINIPELAEGLLRVERPDPYFATTFPATGNTVFAGAVTRMEQAPWLVAFFQPREAFLAPARKQVREALLVALVIAAFVSIAALTWAHYLSLPIRKLTATAERIADGDLSAGEMIQTKDEIGILARTFNLMTVRLRHRIEMESLISFMSRKFINLAAKDTEKAIDEALADIGTFAEADRSFLFRLSPTTKTSFTVTNQWSRPGLEPLPEKLQVFPAQDYPVFMRLLNSEERVHVPDILDPAASVNVRYWQDRGSRSFLCVTMILGEKVLGFLGFETTTAPRHWRTEDTHLLRMTGEIISSTLERQRVERDKNLIEEQLRHSIKMEAVGTLAGGIAHDFNNLLQGMSGYVQLMLMKKDENGQDREYLLAVDQSTKRAAELVRRLLTFSRKMEVVLQPIDLNMVIQNVVQLLERTIPKMVAIKTSFDPDLDLIEADGVQIEQVIINLTNNAVDAMDGSGILHIETRKFPVVTVYQNSDMEIPVGEYVLIEVTDTGKGMDETTRLRVFEPFFTTKEVGKGTGLGLATVYGIVKGHKGYISCSSQPGIGTSFKIFLPAGEVSKQPEAAPEIAEETKPGSESILLVDDEQVILDVAEQMLTAHGYVVHRATSGEDALYRYKQLGARYDLVVLDLGMPGMGGEKFLADLRKIDQEVKIVVASGYAAHDIAKDPTPYGAQEFVPKPYRLNELASVIRKVLDAE